MESSRKSKKRITTNQVYDKQIRRRNTKSLENDTNVGLKILYTNADQFINKRNDLEMFNANDQPDIMLITEIIPKNQVNPITQALLDIEGYKCYLNFNPDECNLGASGIRGVCIYSKIALNVIEVEFSIEGCRDHAWIEIPIGKGDSILCGCIYRTQSNDFDLNGCAQSTKGITDLIRTAYQRNTNLLIAGDFNYKNIDWDNDYAPSGQKHILDFIEALQNCYLFQHVTEPTRYRDNERSNILDLILSSEEGMVQDLSYHPPIGESDHVCLTFNLLHNQQKDYFTPMRNIFKTNYVAVRDELQQRNWFNLLNSNFEDDYETFFNLLNSLLDKHSPMSTQPKKKKNIYMTNEAIRLKNTKGRLWKRYITTRTKFDRENYIRCKNGLRALTRTLRSNFEQNLAFNIKSNPKMFWKYAKNRLKTKQSIPSLTKADGSIALTPKDKADTLNDFFTSVHTIEDLNSIPSTSTSLVEEALSNIQITHETVLMKLKTLNPNHLAMINGIRIS